MSFIKFKNSDIFKFGLLQIKNVEENILDSYPYSYH